MRYCENFYLNWHRNYEQSGFYLTKNILLTLTIVISVPAVEVEAHTVPHFKAPVNGKIEK